MTAPWKYRPREDHLDTQIDWEDNWLSNSIAWVSILLALDRVQPLHLIANPFWTDCPTCLFWRGALFGGIATAALSAIF